MAHFAELNENNEVLRVVVVNNQDILIDGKESEEKGIEFLVNLFGGTWKQTSYNGRIRKNYAGPGMKYDQEKDAFIAQSPFSSWVLDTETCRWKAPIDCPGDIKDYIWNEDSLSWIEA